MMKKTFTFFEMKPLKIQIIAFLFIGAFYFAQQSPPNTRLFQLNTPSSGSMDYPFVKHLNSAEDEFFFSVRTKGNIDFLGTEETFSEQYLTRKFARLGPDGIPIWKASFFNTTEYMPLNVSGDFDVVDKNDNLISFFGVGTDGLFIDANNATSYYPENAGISSSVLAKLNKDGALLWSKRIVYASGGTAPTFVLTTDNNANIYLLGYTQKSLIIDSGELTSEGNTLFIIKYSPDGNLLYSKKFEDKNGYNLIPEFDNSDHLYIFMEPINVNGLDYLFDNLTVPTNNANVDLLMLKLDTSGNPISGKNFYADYQYSSPSLTYAWPNDVAFDGTNFILMGNYYAQNTSSYLGLDLEVIPKFYTGVNYVPFFAKISTTGEVLWQKAVESSQNVTGNYTNINLDDSGNAYMYFFAREKIYIDGEEHVLPSTGSKNLLKLANNGAFQYLKTIDNSSNSNQLIDVFGNDQVNVTGITNSSYILGYPINNQGSNSVYVATFGTLNTGYMTPINNYSEVENLNLDEIEEPHNTADFYLVNNVDWNISTEENWLHVSADQLAERGTSSVVSGKGDAKITINADVNNTGAERNGTITISGEGVENKTVGVLQKATLSENNSDLISVQFYPNPTSEILNIISKTPISNVEIYDNSGKYILKTSNIQKRGVNVKSLTPGVYIIKIHTKGGILTSKFIRK